MFLIYIFRKNRHGNTLKHLFGDVPDIGIKMQLDAVLDKMVLFFFN